MTILKVNMTRAFD